MIIGENIKHISFTATNNINAQFNDYTGKWLILYFYPKDATPGCTTEAKDFRDAYPQFQALNTEVFGISRDNLKSHERFKEKHNLPFELISDSESKLCELFHVVNMKSLFGKTALGVERSTFLIDPEGNVCHEWRKVRAKGHVEALLKKLHSLNQ